MPTASFVRHSPVASKFSSEKPSGSITRWQVAHAGFLRCSSSRSRTDSTLPPSLFSCSVGTFGGGGGGGVPRMFSRIHLPRSTGDVRLGYDVTASTLPWPSRPRRFSSGSVTRRNRLP